MTTRNLCRIALPGVLSLGVLIIAWYAAEWDKFARYVQLLATLVVAGATIWYARLTHYLLRHSEQQFEHLLTAERASRRDQIRTLRSRCGRLLETVRTFPNPLVWEKFKLATLWEDDDVVGLEGLAASIGSAELQYAGAIVRDLRWFKDRYDDARKGNWPQVDISGDRMTDRWQSNLAATIDNLEMLVKGCTEQLPPMERFSVKP